MKLFVAVTDNDWYGFLRARAIGDRPVPHAILGDLYSEPVPTRRRLGQGAFRIVIADAYERRCAVSGERALPALEAAHIRPVKEGGQQIWQPRAADLRASREFLEWHADTVFRG